MLVEVRRCSDVADDGWMATNSDQLPYIEEFISGRKCCCIVQSYLFSWTERAEFPTGYTLHCTRPYRLNSPKTEPLHHFFLKYIFERKKERKKNE